MACTPFTIGTGIFTAISPWSTAASSSMAGKSVTRTAAGITVTGPTGSVFHPTLSGYTSKFLQFGSDGNVLLLSSETGGGLVNRNVTIIDFSTMPPTEKLLFLSSSSSTAVNEPVVHQSPGAAPLLGKAFLIWSSSGTQIQNLNIHRSDNGDILCQGPLPFIATGFTSAEATVTELIIRCSACGPGNEKHCPRPSGECDVTPALRTFPDAVLGGAPVLATTTGQFTIKNIGDDCLTINAIGNVPPFSVTSTSIPLPASLSPLQTMTVEVTFAPTSLGTFGPTDLPVTRTPAKGDSVLKCSGQARAAIPKIGFSAASIGFGTVPVGGSASKTLTIKNTGEKDINVSVAASSPASPFQWPAFNGIIPYSGNHPHIITFTPTAETAATAALTVASDDPASPHTISLSGAGCVANAAIGVPPIATIDFGQVQRGFRTVRYIVVANTGDGPLTFSARVDGTDAVLYGLQPPSGSVTDVLATRSYAVDPVVACGPLAVGSGETIVAVAFFANDAPRLTQAELIVEGHNATNTTTSQWVFPMSAEIVPPVAVDAAEVLDRSGSMTDPTGERTKSDAEISAGQLFARLARPDIDDRLTLVKFSTTPDVFQPIVAVTSGNQTSVVNKINSTELAPSGWTAIAGGVMVGLDQLAVPRPVAPPQLNKAMVVLTDGMDNRAYENPADGQWYSLLGGVVEAPSGGDVDTLPVPAPPGVKLYAVGIGTSENIDIGRLTALAQATGGYFGIVGELTGKSYFDLEKYFTQIYMDAVDTAGIMDPVFTIAPGQEHRNEFDVLQGDVRALVVIYDREGKRLPFHVVSPLGELIDASLVPAGFQLRSGATATARFLEFVMPPGEPARYAGRWAVVVRHNGQVCFGDPTAVEPAQAQWGFLPGKCRPENVPVDYGLAIGVGSNFRMQPYVTPATVHTGESILLTAVVSEAGLPVTGCVVTVKAVSPGGTAWSLTLVDDGNHQDGEADDGEYAMTFLHTAEAGSYEFTFRATGYSRDGEPVTREAVRAKYVVGRFSIDPVVPLPERPDTCCRRIVRFLWIIVVLLVIVVILLIRMAA